MESPLWKLVFAVAAIGMALPVRFALGGDELDIILRSDLSTRSGKSVKGLSIQITSDSNTSLEAVTLHNVSALTQLQLGWYKDDRTLRAPLSLQQNICDVQNATVRCSLNLLISTVNGSKSGNYSVMLRQSGVLVAEAYVNIVFGEARAINFTVVPSKVVNCSADNSSTVLSYSAVGFPTPMYKLYCSGWPYASEPSITGTFVIPPAVCCAGAVCRATAFNGYDSMNSEDAIVREQPMGAICQQHIGCVSPRLKVIVQSCSSDTSGSIVNGGAISIAGDDSVAALEAIAYQRVTKFTQLRLDWYKDGRGFKAPSSVRMQYCDGSPMWGSWMSCRLRVPFSAINGNLSGNYTVTLSAGRLLASAWVVVTVGGEGSPNCSLSNNSLPIQSGLYTFPLTCGQYNDTQTSTYFNATVEEMETNTSTVATISPLSNNVSLVVSAVTLAILMVAAIITVAVCRRPDLFSKRSPLNQNPVSEENRYYENLDVFAAEQFAPCAGSNQDRGCDAVSTEQLLSHPITPNLQLTAKFGNDIEVDGVVTSVMTESTTPKECLPLATSCARTQCVDQQPPSSTEHSIVRGTSMNAVVSEQNQSVTYIILAQNVQVGAVNTMVVQGNPSSSTVDSDYGSHDADSCSSSSPFFENDCALEIDSYDCCQPQNDSICQVQHEPQEGSAIFSFT